MDHDYVSGKKKKENHPFKCNFSLKLHFTSVHTTCDVLKTNTKDTVIYLQIFPLTEALKTHLRYLACEDSILLNKFVSVQLLLWQLTSFLKHIK